MSNEEIAELLGVSLSTVKIIGFSPRPGSSGKSNGLKAFPAKRSVAVSLRHQQ